MDIDAIRNRAIQIAYARFYEGLPWDKASQTGREDAEASMRAEDVFAALEELDAAQSLTDTAAGATLSASPDLEGTP